MDMSSLLNPTEGDATKLQQHSQTLPSREIASHAQNPNAPNGAAREPADSHHDAAETLAMLAQDAKSAENRARSHGFEESVAHDQLNRTVSSDLPLKSIESSNTTNSSLPSQVDGAADRAPRAKAKSSKNLTPASPASDRPNVDNQTKLAIAAAQNEHGTRVRQPKTAYNFDPLRAVSPSAPTTQKPPPAKKASAKPKAYTATTKRPAEKKRKLSIGSDTSKVSGSDKRRSPSQATQLNAKSSSGQLRKTGKSVTPRSLSPAAAYESPPPEDPDSDIDSTMVYCICRKPDDHSWMIACDGCEEWFHGKCVEIPREDEGLIDNFFCPNCEQEGKGKSTWKPVCRNVGCRNPARLKKGEQSKYCSQECGVQFMEDAIPRSDVARLDESKKKRSKVETDRIKLETNRTKVETAPINPGGPITKLQLKGLMESVDSADEFRSLGSMAPISPPPSAVDEGDSKELANQNTSYTLAEKQRLGQIAKRKSELRESRGLLKDMERFISMAKERASKAAEATGIKELCGFDGRVNWSPQQFSQWRGTEEGKNAMTLGVLVDSSDPEMLSAGICTKKRCSRHATWQKLSLTNTRFEEKQGADEMKKIDFEEKTITSRAAARNQSGGETANEVIDFDT